MFAFIREFVAINITFLFVVMPCRTEAQQLANPLGFPLQLSGGFGDLRAGHYHAGLDFRTRSSEGHPLHAVLDGYISRVSVNPGGYGLAVYLTHPTDNVMTVYGHLQRFTPQMVEIVKAKQYEKESFAVDIPFEPDFIPVKQGDIIGFSGNSGSSGGPHLHFEVRDLQTGEWIDPLIFYQSQIPDTQKPHIRGLKIYPIEGKGAVYGGNKIRDIPFRLAKNEQPVITETIEAWGEVGLSIRATDLMDGTTFAYGVKDILMTVDSIELFRSRIDRFSPNESRYINSHTDYEEWSKSRSFYMKTFTDPGNNARFIANRNAGKITINEERVYSVVFTLTDLYGNTNHVRIPIQGKKQDITPMDTTGKRLLRWYDYNTFSAKGIRMAFQRNSLYNNLYLQYRVYNDDKYASPVHVLQASPVPFHYPAQLSLFTDSVFESLNEKQYGIVRITPANGRITWIGGKYRDGWFDAEVGEFGAYTVTCDTIPPVIMPLAPATWHRAKKINLRISDNLSGIATYRGEIDGHFILFEFDSKNALVTYTFDNERLPHGYKSLKLTVVDRCGNQSEYNYDFIK